MNTVERWNAGRDLRRRAGLTGPEFWALDAVEIGDWSQLERRRAELASALRKLAALATPTPRAAQAPEPDAYVPRPGEFWLTGRGRDGRDHTHVCDDEASARSLACELGYLPYTVAPTTEPAPEL